MLFLPIFNKKKPLTKFFILFFQLLCVSDRFGRIAQSAKIKFIAPRNSHARAFLRFYILVIRAALFSASWNRSSLKCDMQTHEFKLKLINEKRKISKTSPLSRLPPNMWMNLAHQHSTSASRHHTINFNDFNDFNFLKVARIKAVSSRYSSRLSNLIFSVRYLARRNPMNILTSYHHAHWHQICI